MRRTWIYSIALQVLRCPKDKSRGGGERTSVLQLRVRLPCSRGTDVADLHVMALPLPIFERSPVQVVAFIELILNILDPNWRTKLLGGCVNGPQTKGYAFLVATEHNATNDKLLLIPSQVIDAYLRRALQDLSEGRYQELTAASGILERGSFPQELARLAVLLRGYEPWTRVHDRVPVVNHEGVDMGIGTPAPHTRQCSRPLLRASSAAEFLAIRFSSVDILSEFKEAVNNFERFPLPSRTESERILELCVNEFAKNSRISRNSSNETILEHGMCLEGDSFRVGQFCWYEGRDWYPICAL
ncbi:hypothetical protein GQ600_2810 [Phytophthora cactorum]|nr:hypothetical protein GQ600_2810 [Phytophthora cactorum]